MSRLFNKAWKVVVATQPAGATSQFFETTGNAIEITEARVSFSIAKSLAKEPNKASVKLYNLNATSRGMLDQEHVTVSLLAGYNGAPRLLFTGDLKYSRTKLEGSDVVTSLEAGDGMRAFQHARMDRSYKPPIRTRQVLEDAAKSLNLTLPPEVEQSADLRTALATGISLSGPTREMLTRLLAPYGYGWSVQNGTLVILRDGQVRAGEAVLVNEEVGLIGSPERAAPGKPGEAVPVTFDVLLYPELVPGNPVKLESQFINGVFRLKECTHEGDSHDDGEWKTSCKAEPT